MRADRSDLVTVVQAAAEMGAVSYDAADDDTILCVETRLCLEPGTTIGEGKRRVGEMAVAVSSGRFTFLHIFLNVH